MSTSTAAVEVQDTSLKSAAHDYWSKVKAGDIGALPAVLGLLVLCIVFGSMSSVFLTPGNFANLLTQAASVIVIAMGLIFVLLLGEIDLSAGYASGVCGAVLVILITDHGQPWYIALAASIAVGMAMGFGLGTLVARLGIPSFVVTLAAFLGFQGILLILAGEGGTIRVDDETVLAIQNSNLSPTLSWAFYIAASVFYVLLGLSRINARRKAGLKAELFKLWLIKTVSLVGVSGLAVWALNLERSNNRELVSLKGIPYVVPVILFLLVIGTFVLGRTAFGRHIYAVGGNAEAARRAGIRVSRVRITVFMISSTFAGIAGILLASRQASVDAAAGRSIVLSAIAAAVVGGVSLFGGRGKLTDAVIGGFVIAVIDNGLGLIGLASGLNLAITGGVLLLAATADAITSRKSKTS